MQLGDGPPVLDPSTGFTFHLMEGRSFDVVTGTSHAACGGVRAR